MIKFYEEKINEVKQEIESLKLESYYRNKIERECIKVPRKRKKNQTTNELKTNKKLKLQQYLIL